MKKDYNFSPKNTECRKEIVRDLIKLLRPYDMNVEGLIKEDGIKRGMFFIKKTIVYVNLLKDKNDVEVYSSGILEKLKSYQAKTFLEAQVNVRLDLTR